MADQQQQRNSFPGGLVVKNPLVNAGDIVDSGSIPGSKRAPGEENGNPLQHFCLGNPTDRGAGLQYMESQESDHDSVTKQQQKQEKINKDISK